MANLPEREQQILLAHAGLIQRVVMAAQQSELQPSLEPILKASEENGWTTLVAAIRRILGGERDARILAGLDEEDRVITEAILRGLHDPASLQALSGAPDPSMAAGGLAGMIDAAAKGDVEALQLLGNMAEQMNGVGGDMARLGGILRRMINGERDPERLSQGMGPQGEQLVTSILNELGKLRVH